MYIAYRWQWVRLKGNKLPAVDLEGSKVPGAARIMAQKTDQPVLQFNIRGIAKAVEKITVQKTCLSSLLLCFPPLLAIVRFMLLLS